MHHYLPRRPPSRSRKPAPCPGLPRKPTRLRSARLPPRMGAVEAHPFERVVRHPRGGAATGGVVDGGAIGGVGSRYFGPVEGLRLRPFFPGWRNRGYEI